jgi:hypothetical protein
MLAENLGLRQRGHLHVLRTPGIEPITFAARPELLGFGRRSCAGRSAVDGTASSSTATFKKASSSTPPSCPHRLNECDPDGLVAGTPLWTFRPTSRADQVQHRDRIVDDRTLPALHGPIERSRCVSPRLCRRARRTAAIEAIRMMTAIAMNGSAAGAGNRLDAMRAAIRAFTPSMTR